MQDETIQLVVVQSSSSWPLVISAPGCGDGIKSQYGFSAAAAAAGGAARHVAETDATMVDDA